MRRMYPMVGSRTTTAHYLGCFGFYEKQRKRRRPDTKNIHNWTSSRCDWGTEPGCAKKHTPYVIKYVSCIFGQSLILAGAGVVWKPNTISNHHVPQGFTPWT